MAKSDWTRVSYGASDNPGEWDTGTGAKMYVDDNPAYPGIERVRIVDYCGRSQGARYFRIADNPDQTFNTLKEAIDGLVTWRRNGEGETWGWE